MIYCKSLSLSEPVLSSVKNKTGFMPVWGFRAPRSEGPHVQLNALLPSLEILHNF